MSKSVRILSGLCLWFAWLVLTAHLLIPHDHHLMESFNSQEESCPASHDAKHHHSGFPIHCHAFNDLASEKATTFVLNDNIQSDKVSFDCFSDVFSFDLQSSFITIHEIRNPIPDSLLLELSALRAPPAIV